MQAGFKATDLFRAVGDGRIKALWIMATNPADSLPEADSVVAALKALSEEGTVPVAKVAEAIAKYAIQADKINPLYA